MTRAFRLGVFILGSLLILAIGIFLIGSKQFLFRSTYRLRADFQNVVGLNNGAEVRVGGIHQGTVTEIDLPNQPDAKVSVLMKMSSATRDIVRKDSVASIKTEGLLGNKYVDVSFGSKSSARVESGDNIRGEPPSDEADLARQTVTEAKAGVTAFHEDMDALKHNFLLRGFFNNRGYEDSSKLTEHAIPRLPAKSSSKEFDYDSKDIFDKPDTAKLKNQKLFKEAGRFLEENKFGLAVVASSETLGDTQEVRVLTEARAMVVRDYLANNFRLDDSKLKTIGLGKSRKAGSSRVQILIYASGSTAPSSQEAANRP